MSAATIGFIGAGNMTTAIIGGMIKAGYNPKQIWASNPSIEKLHRLKEKYEINITQNNTEVADHVDLLVLAVKPQKMAAVTAKLFSKLPQHPPVILSIAAGLPVASLKKMLGFDASIVRAMPNTPSLLGEGITGLYATNDVKPYHKELAESVLKGCGMTLWVDNEDEINNIIAIAGSSPAYFFLFMEAMIDKAIEMGFSPNQAKQLTLQAALGSAKMAMESGEAPATLKQNVMSKGGATEKAIEAFENNGIRQTVAEAMQAAADRAEEMAKQLG